MTDILHPYFMGNENKLDAILAINIPNHKGKKLIEFFFELKVNKELSLLFFCEISGLLQ